jgi:hypothetical protein
MFNSILPDSFPNINSFLLKSMKTTTTMTASFHKAVKLGASTILATGILAIIGANPAQADGFCNNLMLGSNPQCNHSEADFDVTNVVLTDVSGFTLGAGDALSYNLVGNSLNPQLQFIPANMSPFSGTLTYTISLKNGRTFETAAANITGAIGPFTTTTTSPFVTATSTNGTGSVVNFSTNGLLTQTFTQTFSATGGNISSIGSIYGTSDPIAAPGPLPLLGVGAAFGFSRKLRRRIQLSA